MGGGFQSFYQQKAQDNKSNIGSPLKPNTATEALQERE